MINYDGIVVPILDETIGGYYAIFYWGATEIKRQFFRTRPEAAEAVRVWLDETRGVTIYDNDAV